MILMFAVKYAKTTPKLMIQSNEKVIKWKIFRGIMSWPMKGRYELRTSLEFSKVIV
jgi:hypothetical protein